MYCLPRTLEEARLRLLPNIGHYVVWFYEEEWLPEYDLGELSVSLGLEVVAILNDGIILQNSGIIDSDDFRRDEDLLAEIYLDGANFIIDAYYKVYIDDQQNRLLYVRLGKCTLRDIESKIELQVLPTQGAHSQNHPSRHSFDDLSFYFYDNELTPITGYCIVTQTLPGYAIAAIRTGQRTNSGDNIWYESYTFNP